MARRCLPIDSEGLGEFRDASQAPPDDTSVMQSLTRLSASVESARLTQFPRQDTPEVSGATPDNRIDAAVFGSQFRATAQDATTQFNELSTNLRACWN